MKYHPSFVLAIPDLPRRRFVQGLAAGGVLLGASAWSIRGWAQNADADGGLPGVPILRGTEFDLVVANTPVNFTGNPGMATAINGSIPAPTLHWREGETVTLRVTNKLPVSTSIHWHGIILP
jgi:FtsP/CotA-like multicopper oxidase with cupredoxin domain